MRYIIKISILWIIGLIYFPIGLHLIQVINTPLSIIIAFLILSIIIILPIKYYIKERGK